MKKISIYTLTSKLHDEQAVAIATQEFLSSLVIGYELKGADFSDYGSSPLSVIYVRTGGTEGLFKSLLPQLQARSSHPIYLLASDKSNSLAASMEILSYLRQQGLRGEIIHGFPTRINLRLVALQQVEIARRCLRGQRLGVIGQPSDWLISSHADAQVIREKLGVELVDIDIQEVLEEFNSISQNDSTLEITPSRTPSAQVASALPDAMRLYHALRKVIERHNLAGFTIRCFDLLTAIHNTGCLALAKLNAEGVVAGCEGDVPAALSMLICQALLDITGFQANPSSIEPGMGMITLAHCTIPLNIVSSYELDTHYESGIGVGICGKIIEGDATIFKVSGDLSRYFIAEGTMAVNKHNPSLCRTQVKIWLDNPDPIRDYFLSAPIGNHHIVLPGYHQSLLEEFMHSM